MVLLSFNFGLFFFVEIIQTSYVLVATNFCGNLSISSHDNHRANIMSCLRIFFVHAGSRVSDAKYILVSVFPSFFFCFYIC